MLLYIAYIGYAFLLLNNILYLKEIKSFSEKFGKAFAYFTYYLLWSFFIQVLTEVLSILYLNNLFLSHFYFLGQFLFLSLFFRELIDLKTQRVLLTKFFLASTTIIIIQYLFSPQLFYKFNLIEIFFSSFFIIICTTFYMYNSLEQKRKFYVLTIGLLIYLFGSTILFILGNVTNILSREYTKIPWILNGLLYIVYQVFILIEWVILMKSIRNED